MQSNWQQDFFRGVALDAWRRMIPVEVTRKEVEFIERVLGVAADAQLLDVPCGNGRMRSNSPAAGIAWRASI